jgi:hypothetical protein
MSKDFNVTLKNVRFSFPQLGKPATEGKSKGKYSVQVSFPKDSTNVQLFVNAVNHAIKEGVNVDSKFKALANRVYAPGMTIGQSKFLQDGDLKYDSKKGEPIKMLENCYFFQPTSRMPIPCFKKLETGKLQKLLDPGTIYAGDYGDLILAIKPGCSKEHGIYIGLYPQAIAASFTGENLESKSLNYDEAAALFGAELDESDESTDLSDVLEVDEPIKF